MPGPEQLNDEKPRRSPMIIETSSEKFLRDQRDEKRRAQERPTPIEEPGTEPEPLTVDVEWQQPETD
jgi:hypothetical protein